VTVIGIIGIMSQRIVILRKVPIRTEMLNSITIDLKRLGGSQAVTTKWLSRAPQSSGFRALACRAQVKKLSGIGYIR
jgi:hypothetical protein